MAIYDLTISPVTFDILPFLVAAESARRDAGAAAIHFVLVPAEGSALIGDPGEMTLDAITWRERQITLAATALMPSVRATSVLADRSAAHDLISAWRGPRYPESYTLARPIAGFSVAECEAVAFRRDEVPSLRAPAQALIYAARWLDTHARGRKPISITLREADNAAAKNSNVENWAAFVRTLDESRIFPFLIRDTDRVFDPVPDAFSDIAQFPLASVNIELRAAIYEQSFLNLVGGSGPLLLCLFDRDIRCLVFNLGVSNWHDTLPTAYRENYGIEPGGQLLHTTPYQRIVWGPDDATTISSHFDAMIRFIEFGEAGLADDTERSFILPREEPATQFAERVFFGRQWGPAKTIYRHLLTLEPHNAEWTYRLGVAETWAGNPLRGLELLQKALDLGLTTASLYLARCEALLFLCRPEQAVANARFALELEPENFDAALRLGLVYEAIGRIAEASEWIGRAASLRPDSLETRRYLDILRRLPEPTRA